MKGPGSGRREGRIYRAVMYAVLAAGALPIVLPLYWLVLASLKSRAASAISPPEWLPLDVQHTVRIGGQAVPVIVFDDAAASHTGVWRVKVVRGAEGGEDEAGGAGLLKLQRGDIVVVSRDELRAVVDGVERIVEPAEKSGENPGGDSVAVLVPGVNRTATVPAGGVLSVREERRYWLVLGEEIPVELVAGAAEDGMLRVQLAGSVQPIKVAPGLYRAGTSSVTWGGRELPVRLVSASEAGGYLEVQLTPPAPGLAVPAAELRHEVRSRTYADVGGTRFEVLPLEALADGATRVELIGQPQRLVLPAAAITRTPRRECFATILGQRRAVEPQVWPLPEAADASVSVFVPGAIAVAGERVQTERHIRPQWRNFAAAWREQDFALYVANTLFIAALVVLGTVLSCGLVGYAFARLEFRGRDALFLVLLATLMVPGQVTAIPQFVLFVKFGWIDTYLPLIVPHFLAASAFFVFLFRQYLLTIPNELEDAARIDGCGPLATWWLVMMPLSRPIIITVAVFAFTGVWNDFLAPLLYINSDEKQTVALGLQNFKSAFQGAEPQLIMAASVMMIVPTVVLFFVAQKAFMRGVVVSGVKG